MDTSFCIGEWLVEPQLNTISDSDKRAHLEPKIMHVLLCLAEHPGEVVSKEKLIQSVWLNTFVTDDVLTRAIAELRKAFGDDAREPRYIQTIPRTGYRLIAPVVHGSVNQETDRAGTVSEIRAAKRPLPRQLRWQVLVICLILAGLAIAAFYLWSKPKQPGVEIAVKSIAVLPFKPLVIGERNEAIELGMADNLITKLSNLRQITVRPISAMRRYTSLEQDPIAAGREQQVDAVLDSSLQWSGEKVRVSVRLFSVQDGRLLWADMCDEVCSPDIFKMQDSIAEKIARALELRLTGEERERLVKHYTENREAFQLYSMGRFFWNKWTREGLEKSIEYYRRAIAIDPNYALAYAGMAESYNVLGGFFGAPMSEVVPKIKDAVSKALKIDDKLAEVHAVMGKAKLIYDRDWPGAERDLKRAIALNPNFAEGHSVYGVFLLIMGRWDESIAEAKLGQKLNPLSLYTNMILEGNMYSARQYSQAIEQSLKTLEIDPNFIPAHQLLAKMYLFKGMHDEAVAEFEKVDVICGSNPALGAARRKAYEAAGIEGYLQKHLYQMKEAAKRPVDSSALSGYFILSDEPSRLGHVRAMDFATIYALLGDKDQALQWLEKAYDEHSTYMNFLKGEPVWDNLRSDPRFTELLRRMKLAP
jgi:DNA-binding winged helix-turn-helix (wHTH) protein/TolB-like protein